MASRPWRLSAKLLILSSVVDGARLLRDLRQRHARHAPRRGGTGAPVLENLATGIDADINRNIEIYDLSLRAVAGNMVMPEIRDVSTSLRHLILFDHAATAKHFGAIQVFDAAGRLTIDASTLDPRPENRSRRRVLPGPSRSSRRRPFHQPPDASPRRLRHRAEPPHHRRRRSFQGVVAGSIRFSYFHDLFGRLVSIRTTPSPCCAATAPSSCARRSTPTSSAGTWQSRAKWNEAKYDERDLCGSRVRSIRRRGCGSGATAPVRSIVVVGKPLKAS